MKVNDIIFALICGKAIGFIVGDFLKGFSIAIGFYYFLILWVVLPLIALFCLWLAYSIGKKLIVVFQIAKFLLVGAFAVAVDLKLFEGLLWLGSFFILLHPIIVKGISFLFSTVLKYWGNKYWTFQKHEKETLHKEIVQFFAITAIGLAIDLVAFYYATEVIGPMVAIPTAIWVKIAVIFAAVAAALWNFLGYKFFVFKK